MDKRKKEQSPEAELREALKKEREKRRQEQSLDDKKKEKANWREWEG